MNPTQHANASSSTDLDLDSSSNFVGFLAFLHILTILLTALGNSLVITVIVCSQKLRTITSGFLLNLAISDLAAGLLLLPFAAHCILNPGCLYQQAPCTLLGFLYTFLCFASTWTLACISLERFVAINCPLTYHQLVNRRRAIIAIALIWLGATLNATFPFAEQVHQAYAFLPQYTFCLLNYHNHIVTAIVIPILAIFVPLGIMCYTYVSIGQIACSHAKRKIAKCNKDHCVFVAPKTKDYRAAKILAVMAGVFLICWIPFTILSLWQATTNTHFPFVLTATSLWLTFLSSAINPWLYSLLNRTFRQAMRSQGARLLHSVGILRQGTGDLGNTGKVLSNVNRVDMAEGASCQETLIGRHPLQVDTHNLDDSRVGDIVDTDCTGSLHKALANRISKVH